MLANGRHRKTKITQLEQEEGIIVGDANLKDYITDCYKRLFRPHLQNSFSLDETLRHDIPQVSEEEETEVLVAPFSEEEVKMAIFDMEHNKAPGLDGFPIEFYQFFWDVVKQDLMSLFMNFIWGDCIFIV